MNSRITKYFLRYIFTHSSYPHRSFRSCNLNHLSNLQIQCQKSSYGVYPSSSYPKVCNIDGTLQNGSFGHRKYSTVDEFDNSLGKLLSHIAHDIKDKGRVYKNDLMQAFKNTKGPVSERDGILLLKSCSYLFEEPSDIRIEILKNIWTFLKDNSNITTNHFNEKLKSYIDNNQRLIAANFIQEMHPNKPNNDTYLLLLKSASGQGDIHQITEIMENIKSRNIPYTENIFCLVMEGYARNKDLKTVSEVFDKMKTLSIPITSETEMTHLKTFIITREIDSFRTKLSEIILSGVKFTDDQAMDIINTLVNNDMKGFLPECLSLFPNTTLSAPSLSHQMQTFCLKLVNSGHKDSAYFLYSHLSSMDIGNSLTYSVYGRLLLRKSIQASNSLDDDILLMIKSLQKSKRNEYSLNTAFEASIHYGKLNMAIDLLKLMNETNVPIRCHYFWPLFIGFAKNDGEEGVFRILKEMKLSNVKIDNETFTDYVIPYVNTFSPKDLIKKFRDYNISLTECLSPIILQLIKNGKVAEASEICELTEGKIDPELLMMPLLHNFFSYKDFNSVHNILRAFQTKSKDGQRDWIGMFILNFVSWKKWEVDLKDLEKLIMVLHESDTRISSRSVELSVEYLNRFKENLDVADNIKKLLSNMTDVKYSNDETISRFPVLTNQQTMTIPELEGHLIQLEAGKMNTRGVMRKLFQQYTQQNELDKAKHILTTWNAKKFPLSDGMKASALSLFIKCGDLKKAEYYLNDLRKSNPKFLLDEHKIIDYATLLVKNNQISKALDILQKRADDVKIRGGSNIETNCRLLLSAVSSIYDPAKVEETLLLLHKLRYCKVSNILLGPQVRAYLNRSDIVGAVNEFIKCTNKYRKTPLKHEICCILVSGSSKGNLSSVKNIDIDNSVLESMNRENYQDLLVQVQAAIQRVHGSKSSQVALILAFADTGLEKPMRNLILDPSFCVSHETLLEQCQRLADELKTDALAMLARNFSGVNGFKAIELYELTMKTICRNGNLIEALDLWSRMHEINLKPSQNTAEYLANMFKSHKKEIPDSVQSYLDTKKRKVLENA